VAKFPRFPFDKFTSAPNTLGTQMKATGEVMGIGSTLDECFLKSVRSLETGVCHFHMPKFDTMSKDELVAYIAESKDDNIFAWTQLIRLGMDLEELHELTKVTDIFLQSLKRIVDMEETLKVHPFDLEILTAAKKMGFSDKYVARMWKCTELEVYGFRKEHNLFPVFRMVDTCHTGAYIPYFYSSYTGENASVLTNKKKIVVMSALVLLLAVTAVFNFVLANNRQPVSADSGITTANYFTTYRAERTTTRSEELVQLDSVIALCEAGDEKYEEATKMKLDIVSAMEQELILENMVKSLGF
jgi:hypothetical protein